MASLRVEMGDSRQTRAATKICRTRAVVTGAAALMFATSVVSVAWDFLVNRLAAETDDARWYEHGAESRLQSVCSTFPPRGAACPEGWEDWRGAGERRCFLLVREALPWEAARTNCRRSRAADLASVPDAAANAALRRLCGAEPCWIGAFWRGAGWYWLDGGAWGNASWAEGEPKSGGTVASRVAIGAPGAPSLGRGLAAPVRLLLDLACLAAVGGVCLGFYLGATSRNPRCLSGVAYCDCLCVVLAATALVATSFTLSRGGDKDLALDVVLQILAIGVFLRASVLTWRLGRSLTAADPACQRSSCAAPPGVVVGVPVVGKFAESSPQSWPTPVK